MFVKGKTQSLIIYIISLVACVRACVRLSDTTILHFNSPAELGCCIFYGRTDLYYILAMRVVVAENTRQQGLLPASVTFWRCESWWRRDTRQRGPETQVLRAKCSNTRVVKTWRQQQKKITVSVYRGPETQVLRAKYRSPETQVLKAKCSNT